MNEQVYKKVGRKYIPIGYSDGWTGFPSDGIWLVQTKPGSKSSECIMKLGEVENFQPTINLILGYRDKLLQFMDEVEGTTIHKGTRNEFVLNMLKEISK